MKIERTNIPDTFVIVPQQHADDRGVFLEWFRADRFSEMTGHPFNLAQANCSVSSAGTLRGIHFAQVPPGQAKYVTCAQGSILDVVIDIRVGSPTYGAWEGIVLDDVERKAVYIAEGLGHAFLALTDGAVVNYLCSAQYAPGREHGIHPLDPAIGIEWPTVAADGSPLTIKLSGKDEVAPTLAEVAAAGLLPTYEESQSYVASLRGEA